MGVHNTRTVERTATSLISYTSLYNFIVATSSLSQCCWEAFSYELQHLIFVAAVWTKLVPTVLCASLTATGPASYHLSV